MGNEEKSYTKIDEIIKVTLTGSSSVGKTNIIRRYLDNENLKNPASTNGGSYAPKLVNINNKLIQIDLWDTAGQERFLSLGKHFYRDASIVILVYDITSQSSFEEIKTVWYPYIKEYRKKGSVLALVGNNSHLFEYEEVMECKAKEYAQQIGAIFMLISSKTGDNIDLLFETLIKQYFSIHKNLNEIKREKGETVKLSINKKKKKKGDSC